MPDPSFATRDNPKLGIAFVLVGMVAISAHDMLVKHLSGDYPLHQMIFVRSAIGLCFSLVILQFEGGFVRLKTQQFWLHALRCALIVATNLTFFAALPAIPLADATALFYVAPLFITLLAIPFLGESIGPRRLIAVAIGLVGVALMMRPGADATGKTPDRLLLLLPVISAFAYACMQILTRRLGISSPASAMSVYVQATFVTVSAGLFFIAGDGRFAEGLDDPSLLFLLRAWVWPGGDDWGLFGLLGLLSGLIGYTMAQAYRLAPAATVAPFEYTALPLAVFWGWLVFGHLPGPWVFAGSLLIAAAGLYVFLREKRRARPLAVQRPLRRV